MADYTPRLKKQYADKIRAALKEEFGYKNDMQIPRLDKIVLNMGVGEAVSDTKKVRAAAADLAQIAGQKPVVTKAKKSIAGFKLREEMPIGAKVTLRRDRIAGRCAFVKNRVDLLRDRHLDRSATRHRAHGACRRHAFDHLSNRSLRRIDGPSGGQHQAEAAVP